MKKIITFTLIALFAFTSLFAQGAKEALSKEKVYTVAVSSDYPPLEYTDENGSLCGYEVELIQAVADAAEIKVQFVNAAFDEIITGIENDKYDIGASGFAITDERKKSVDFTSPVIHFTLSIITKDDNTDISSVSDLEGKKVGVQSGSFCQSACEEAGLTPSIYDKAPNAILDLADGKLDAVVFGSVVAENYVHNDETYSKVLKIAASFENSYDMAIAVKKGNTELLSLLNDGLKKVEESGEMSLLKSKYGIN